MLPIKLRLRGRNLGECCWLRRMSDLTGSFGLREGPPASENDPMSSIPSVEANLVGEPWLNQYGKLTEADLQSLAGKINPSFCDGSLPNHPMCANDRDAENTANTSRRDRLMQFGSADAWNQTASQMFLTDRRSSLLCHTVALQQHHGASAFQYRM